LITLIYIPATESYWKDKSAITCGLTQTAQFINGLTYMLDWQKRPKGNGGGGRIIITRDGVLIGDSL
jgi:hypothetical protein